MKANSSGVAKAIRLSRHALGYTQRRGFTQDEVIDVIRRRAEEQMKIQYDAEVDALSIVFRETTVTTAELAEGIVGEYDVQGRLVGLEVLDAASRFGDPSVMEQVILEGVGLASGAPHGGSEKLGAAG